MNRLDWIAWHAALPARLNAKTVEQLSSDIEALIRVARAADRISKVPLGTVYDDDDLIQALAPLLEEV